MFGYFMKTYLSLSDLCRYLFGKSYLLPEKQGVNFGDRKFKKFRCKVCKEDLLHITHNLVEYLILGWWADFHKHLDKNEVWNHLKEHILSTSDRANPAWLWDSWVMDWKWRNMRFPKEEEDAILSIFYVRSETEHNSPPNQYILSFTTNFDEIQIRTLKVSGARWPIPISYS